LRARGAARGSIFIHLHAVHAIALGRFDRVVGVVCMSAPRSISPEVPGPVRRQAVGSLLLGLTCARHGRGDSFPFEWSGGREWGYLDNLRIHPSVVDWHSQALTLDQPRRSRLCSRSLPLARSNSISYSIDVTTPSGSRHPHASRHRHFGRRTHFIGRTLEPSRASSVST
jgi:hypothetical protein